MANFKYLFTPLKIGSLTVRNRLYMTTHGPRFLGKRYLRYLEERARGGVGLIGLVAGWGVYNYPFGPGQFALTSFADEDAVPPNPSTSEGISILDQIFIPMMREQGEVIHRFGASCIGQIYHGGANQLFTNWQPITAPSAVIDPFRCQVPHELDVDEIQKLIQAYGHAARRIKECGLDGIEVHGAHGYLVHQFFSPYHNKRTDQYGGSLDNRLRFIMEVLTAMRGYVGKDFPIGIRMNGDEFVDGGLRVQDMQQIAQRLAGKVDFINVSGGNSSGLKDGVKLPYVAPWYIPLGPNVLMAAAIRQVVDIPVMVGGRINDPVHADKILADGYADMIGMVRAFIADPEFANKAREGRTEDIRKCIGCNEGCRFRSLMRASAGLPIGCTVNASVGREEELEIHPATVKKLVLVIGGGPGGMEAARVAKLRGHKVILCEKEKVLGGHIAIISRDPNREERADLVRFLEHELTRLEVEVRLGVEVTPELVAEIKPDAVVVATGAKPYIPPIPGVDSPHVVTSRQVLLGEAQVGNRVLVVGGLDDDLDPPSMGEFLADQGKKVEVLSETMMVGHGLEPGTLHLLTQRLLRKGVTLTPLTSVKSISGHTVEVFNTFTREKRPIEGIDTVVLAAGRRANDRLYGLIKHNVKEVYAVGDCFAPRRTLIAVLEGSRVAIQI